MVNVAAMMTSDDAHVYVCVWMDECGCVTQVCSYLCMNERRVLRTIVTYY